MFVALVFLFLSFEYAVGIKGGRNAQEVVPHMASLQYETTNLCGGVIISSRWILSSAYCTQNYDHNPSLLTVVVGITHMIERGQSFKPDKIIIHDQYFYVYNDLSMVRLKGEIKFDKHVAAIKLPESEAKAGTKVVAAGWGSQQRYGEKSRMLRTLNMTTISLENCNELYKDRRRPLIKEQICAVAAKKESSVCDGDNGGPLDNGTTVVGIVSSTANCGRGKPSIFTNIFYYLKWIEDNMK